MTPKESESDGMISKALQKYHEKTVLRAAIQVIPYAGGAIDTLLSGHGNKIQEERLSKFLEEIRERVEKLESQQDMEPSEELFDFIIQTFGLVTKTRSENKRKRFAEIFAKQVKKQHEWEEAETATRFLADLNELHIQILLEAISTTPCSKPFSGLRVISLKPNPAGNEEENPPKVLAETLSSYSALALRMGCAELISKGLLYDEGVGRFDAKAMEYLVPTDLADWFVSWVNE